MQTHSPLNMYRDKVFWRSVWWLLFLVTFFFSSYNLTNWWASQQKQVGQIVFEWERYIPFLPWTIIPYWIIDFMYGISLFLCNTKTELDTHAKRLLTAQMIAVTCFFFFPLTFGFDRPVTDGLFGSLFTALSAFDRPFNQAPSLHIALLIILWFLFIKYLPRWLLWSFHVLCILIAISVLTTYQHHFIDVPTGALLGFLCVWLWDDNGTCTLQAEKDNQFSSRRFKITLCYLFSATLLFILAFFLGSYWLWLCWPACSLVLVALFYGAIGAKGFQKGINGKISLSTKCLLLPYLLGAKINSRLWTRKQEEFSQVTDRVWIGRFPSASSLKKSIHFSTVIDLTAEFDVPKNHLQWVSIPSLDLIFPSRETLEQAANLIEEHTKKGNVLVVCALGYSRSVLAVITWLLLTKQETCVQSAITKIKKIRPRMVISFSDQIYLSHFIKT
jgi:protein-tyrosine phosphatase/membrane-associated phospholipid phosphatase